MKYSTTLEFLLRFNYMRFRSCDTHFSESRSVAHRNESECRGVDRAIHSMELDSRVDAFFARPSRDRLNFGQIEKAADPIILASRFRCLTAERSSMTDLDKRARIRVCILDKNLRVHVVTRALLYVHTYVHYRSSCIHVCDLFQHSKYRRVDSRNACAFCNLCRRGSAPVYRPQ